MGSVDGGNDEVDTDSSSENAEWVSQTGACECSKVWKVDANVKMDVGAVG